jgi:hypothetical protein
LYNLARNKHPRLRIAFLALEKDVDIYDLEEFYRKLFLISRRLPSCDSPEIRSILEDLSSKLYQLDVHPNQKQIIILRKICLVIEAKYPQLFNIINNNDWNFDEMTMGTIQAKYDLIVGQYNLYADRDTELYDLLISLGTECSNFENEPTPTA